MESEKTNLKVALCLSGQARTFRIVSRNIREVFCSNSNVSVDIFIHTWLDNESYTVQPECQRNEIREILEQDLVTCFSPKRYKIEDRTSFRYREDQWMCQAHSVAESVNLMRPFQEDYDWVFWTRLDCIRADFSKEYYTPDVVNYSNLQEILNGHFTDLVEGGSEFQKFFNYECNQLRALSCVVFSPYRCEPEGWCGNVLHLQDWSLMGTPGPMLRVLGDLEETVQLLRLLGSHSSNAMYDAEGMSMELTLPFALAYKRVGLVTTDKILSPNLWIYRPWAEKCKLDPYRTESWKILKDILNVRNEEWHIETSLEEIYQILEDRYDWNVTYGHTNSSIRERDKSSKLI